MMAQIEVQSEEAEESASVQHSTEQSRTICTSTVMKMDIKKQMFLVGDVFMRKFYTIFDRDNNRVGLAKAHTAQQQAALSEKSKENTELLAQKNKKK